jgi:hypothetical protein
MKQPDFNAHAHLVKIGKEGILSLSIPEMAGKYLIVEQRDGHLTISPFDVDFEPPRGPLGARWLLRRDSPGLMQSSVLYFPKKLA